VLAVMVLTTLIAASVARHYGAALYRDRAEAELSQGDASRALEEARRSLSLNRHDVMTYIAASAAYAQRNEYRLARGSLLAATREEPFNFVPWALMGDLATRRGDLVQARRDYARAAELNPRGVPPVTRMDALDGS
jgi:tetratricopeptide (TPR) repeat protein